MNDCRTEPVVGALLRWRSRWAPALVIGAGLFLLAAGCGSPSGSQPGSSAKVQDACSLLTAAQVAQIFGVVELAGDTPTASHQRQASTCVWGTGVTAAQQTTDPGAASAALEVSYDLGPGAKRSAAEAAMQRACGAAPQSVPGVGGAAYYCNGDMAAVTGPKLVEFLTFSITPPPAVASDAAAMNAALAELRS